MDSSSLDRGVLVEVGRDDDSDNVEEEARWEP